MKHQFVLSIYHSMRGHTSLFLCRFKIEISFSSKQSMPRPFSRVYKIRRTINPVIITSSEERICGKLLNLTFYYQKSAPFLYEDTSSYTLCTFFLWCRSVPQKTPSSLSAQLVVLCKISILVLLFLYHYEIRKRLQGAGREILWSGYRFQAAL